MAYTYNEINLQLQSFRERQQTQWRHLCLQIVRLLISIQCNYMQWLNQIKKRREGLYSDRFIWSNLSACCWSSCMSFISLCVFEAALFSFLQITSEATKCHIDMFPAATTEFNSKGIFQNFNSKCQPFLFFTPLSYCSSSCRLHYYCMYRLHITEDVYVITFWSGGIFS